VNRLKKIRFKKIQRYRDLKDDPVSLFFIGIFSMNSVPDHPITDHPLGIWSRDKDTPSFAHTDSIPAGSPDEDTADEPASKILLPYAQLLSKDS